MAPASGRASGRARLRLHGLTWLVWRTHRAAFRFWIVVSLALTGYLVYWHATAQPLLDDGGATVGLPPDVGISAVSFLVFLAPVLAGMALGTQLFEREYTEGTFRLVCTQSVTAAAWVRAKLCVSAVMVFLCVTPCAAALTWDFRKDPDRQQNWYGIGVFDTIGPAAVAICLLGLFLGAAAGLAWRRSVPAKGLVLVLVLGFKVALFQTLAHLLPRTTATGPLYGTPQVPDNAWVVQSGVLATAGHPPYAMYLPYADLQSLQWITTGFCVVVCAALALFCVRIVRRPS
jgi:hypothetical protein